MADELRMNYQQVLNNTLSVWCPTYPRRCSKKSTNSQGWGQTSVSSNEEIIGYFGQIQGDAPGFVSVYSFPKGHTSDNGENVPLLDTLMFDLDFEGEYDASNSDWERDMSALLVRVRMIAKALIDVDQDKYWRASLSGHKGIHLYLDFPALDRREGTAQQFRSGVKNYTENLIQGLKDETGLSDLDEYIDVVSGKDFARLTRLPNTIHDGATDRFGETRFCVPVSLKELFEISVTDYIDLTRRPRPVPEGCHRVENQRVHDILTKEVRIATDAAVLSGTKSSGSYDEGRVEHYSDEIANDEVTLDMLKMSLRDVCWRFRERDDRFGHGHSSHLLELNCIAEMVSCNTPIEVMIKFFEIDENFDEAYTRSKIRDVISYGYSPFTNEKLENVAPMFFESIR